MMRPGAPLGVRPTTLSGCGTWVCLLLCLLDACLDEHLIELTEHLELVALKGELFLDLGVCRAPLDGVDAFGFEL
jgi:hypothetical protein